MIVALLLNHALGALGLYFVVTVAVKVARGYPIRRWFF
ncbi:UNVERIFIED_ORG: hypothetical protein M2193_000049 [Bradyrhizobium japonicum]